MKKKLGRKVLSLLLATLMLLGAVPFSGSGNLFAPTANALIEGDYEYEVVGGFATIKRAASSISGDVIIPSTLGGYTVTAIGVNAFYNRTSITSVLIPNTVTSIGERSFQVCTALTNITIPNSVTSIGYGAFFYCSAITGFDVADDNPNYSSADGVLFNEDKTLLIQYPVGNPRTSYTVPGSVTNIGHYSFDGCGFLTDIVIPNSVTSIGGWVFSNCISLTNIFIPGSVMNIGVHAFYKCAALTSVTLENGVTSIGDSAFAECVALTGITVPKSVTNIGTSVFNGCNKLTSIDVAADNPKYSSTDGVLFNKDKTLLIKYPIGNTRTSYTVPAGVTGIGVAAFESCEFLTDVTINSGVKNIGFRAFAYCENLTGINLPDSVTSIGEDAFDSTGYYYDDSNWENDVLYIDNCLVNTRNTISGDYTIKDGIITVADGALSYCYNLTGITIPNSVTSIGYAAFNACEALASITLGNGVTSIGQGAFYGCTSLTDITIPKSVMRIGDDAFGSCNMLASIDVAADNPDYLSEDGVLFNKDKTRLIQYPIGNSRTSYTVPVGVTSIGAYAFSACEFLTDVTINTGVTNIDLEAFSYCENLTGINLPDSVTSIGFDAFKYTGYFNDDSNWENDVLYIGNHLIMANDSLSGNYAIKDGTITVADEAFYFCKNLTGITVPNSLKAIGGYAFYNCFNLISITLPDSVSFIGAWAFYGTGYYNDNSNWEDGALYIGNHLIRVAPSLVGDYVIKDGTITIGGEALYNCILTGVTVPKSVANIGWWVFYLCTNLTEIEVADDNPNFSSEDGVLFNKDKTTLLQYPLGNARTSYTVPVGVTKIAFGAFESCTSLTEVIVPDSVTDIDYCAFYNCSNLTSITIPESVASIGYEVFIGCDSLTIFGVPGSYAETYANENNINFSAIGGGGDALSPADGSDSVIDRDNGTIYGLEPGISREEFESNFVSVGNGYSLQYSADVIGTGTVVTVLDENDEVVETYTIVIFGDISGDGAISAVDALMALKAASGALELSEIKQMAGNVDGNANVSSVDALDILHCSTGKKNINQVTGLTA
jgi:hypothetical protein